MANDVSVEELAKIDDVCGRDIKNAVLDAAMRASRQNKKLIELQDFIQSIERIKAARIKETPSRELTTQEKQKIQEKIKEHLNNQTTESS